MSKQIEELNRSSRGSARLARSLACIGLLSIACTLTEQDFEPHEVSSLESTPAGAAGASPAAMVCGGAGCCSSSSDCAGGQGCVDGVCAATCTSGEDLSTCGVPRCPGPGCPVDAPSCTDGIANGREPAVDCGGGCALPCPSGSACNVDRDCQSLRCVGAVCAPVTCSDGVQNGDESAVDCGGSCPRACAVGAACTRDADCGGDLVCPAATHRCTDGSCQDGERTGDEVLPDCGGGSCPGCPVGAPCSDAADCASRVCRSGECAPATCTDGLSSGDESGVDCGGSDPRCARCTDGIACRGDSDCASGACESGTCISCSDGRRDGAETGLDCGGPDPECARCPSGAGCSLDDDCTSDDCQAGACVASSCVDGARNGAETDIDCGGANPDCPRCELGATCALGSDCSSLSCQGGVCTSCSDGVRNGDETDIDCGGAQVNCGGCLPGKVCQADADCASGACQDGKCCGGGQGDCTRCAERLSPSLDCDLPMAGTDSTGVLTCRAFLGCLSSHIDRCPTRNAPGCSGDDQTNDACPHNDYGGNAGTGVTRATQILQNAGCQL